MAQPTITRNRLNEICLELTQGTRPAEVVDQFTRDGRQHATLADGTELFLADNGGWGYPGWSNAGRHLDRVRPDDIDVPAVLAPYGIDLPRSTAADKGVCHFCGLALNTKGQCEECR